MTYNQRTFDLIHELLGHPATHCGHPCEECAFNAEGACGTVVLRNIMRKLAGSDSHTQSMTDNQLIDFIKNNPERKESKTMASKFDNGDLFRNFHAQTFECDGILCRNCAFNTPAHCGAVMLRAFMARLAGASEVVFETRVNDEELIEFIRNNPAVKKESEI